MRPTRQNGKRWRDFLNMGKTNSLSNSSPSETCGLCERGETALIYRSQIVGKGANKIHVRNVPMSHCSSCNGFYFSREVALALEDIRQRGNTSV